jgi:RNA polymerase sigma factor (sigma-70 family)
MSGSTLALRLEADVRAAIRGDERAFARLVDETRNMVTSIALAILGDLELSRDVAQDVYLSAWRDLGKLREATSFVPWLRQVTRHRAHHVLRSKVRRERRVTNVEEDRLLAVAADPSPDAMDRLVDQETRRTVEEAVDALPDGSREVVLLYYREGESARQVAELLDLSEAAVRQRLVRARATLRESLADKVRATAPGAAFTAGVMGALTLAAPSAAAAATLSMGKWGSGAAGKVTGGVVGASAGALVGLLAGLFGGTLGLVFGIRKLLEQARDDEERRGIVQTGVVSMLTMLGFLGTVWIAPRPLPVTIGFLFMMGTFWVVHFLWLPRVTARRKEIERAEDPEAFAAKERVERRNAVWGFTVGALLGGAAVVAAWFF